MLIEKKLDNNFNDVQRHQCQNMFVFIKWKTHTLSYFKSGLLTLLMSCQH